MACTVCLLQKVKWELSGQSTGLRFPTRFLYSFPSAHPQFLKYLLITSIIQKTLVITCMVNANHCPQHFNWNFKFTFVAGQNLSEGALDFQLTAGAAEAYAKTLEMVVCPGDNVLVESPCYTGLLSWLGPQGCNLLGVETDDKGIIPDNLRQVSEWSFEVIIHRLLVSEFCWCTVYPATSWFVLKSRTKQKY